MLSAKNRLIVGILAVTLLIGAARVSAHCDALDGPVIQAAKSALKKGDVEPVLKWVTPEHEKEIRDLFDKTLKVRRLSDEAREVADLHFFETLVRVHRAGEGVAYTGLKPAGGVDPGIKAADDALALGSAKGLADHLGEAIAAGLRERFDKVMAAKAHSEENVEAGRAYVAAYVEYIHYVEAVHALASRAPSEHHHIHQPAR